MHRRLKQRDDREDGRGDRADDGSGRAVALPGGRRGHRLGAGRVVLVAVAAAAAVVGAHEQLNEVARLLGVVGGPDGSGPRCRRA